MKKLQSARDALLNSPLGIKAKDLLTFAEKGTVVSHRGERNQNFAVTYTAHLIVTDFAGEPQDLLFILVRWLHADNPSAQPDAIKFHVDVIDHKKSDVSLAVELSEVIGVAEVEGGLSLDAQPDADALAIGMDTLFPDMPESADA